MLRITSITIAAIGLAACGEMTPEEEARMDVLLACADRASAAFPMLAEQQSGDTEENQAEPEFTVSPNGHFVFAGSERQKDRPLPERFICEGNLNDRTIDFVEFNGVKKRPQPPEVWKF